MLLTAQTRETLFQTTCGAYLTGCVMGLKPDLFLRAHFFLRKAPPLERVTKKLRIIDDEESYLARYQRKQGINYSGVEVAHLVTRRTLEAPVVDKQ